MRNTTAAERRIAKELGLSDAQLATLLRIRQGYSGGTAGEALERKGLATAQWHPETNSFTPRRLTEAGEAILKRARDMGY